MGPFVMATVAVLLLVNLIFNDQALGTDTYQMTILYYNTAHLSWNDAHLRCQTFGNLATAQDMPGQKAIEKVVLSQGQKSWIGLYDGNGVTSQEWKWTPNCDPLDASLTFWDGAGNPAGLNKHKFCVCANILSGAWVTEMCPLLLNSICLQTLPAACPYVEVNKECSGAEVIMKQRATWDSEECQTMCSNLRQNDNLCWAYTESTYYCKLFFTPDPFFCDEGSSGSTGITIYIRDCFSFVTITANQRGPNTDSLMPVVSCGETTTTTTTTTTNTTTPPPTTTTTNSSTITTTTNSAQGTTSTSTSIGTLSPTLSTGTSSPGTPTQSNIEPPLPQMYSSLFPMSNNTSQVASLNSHSGIQLSIVTSTSGTYVQSLYLDISSTQTEASMDNSLISSNSVHGTDPPTQIDPYPAPESSGAGIDPTPSSSTPTVEVVSVSSLTHLSQPSTPTTTTPPAGNGWPWPTYNTGDDSSSLAPTTTTSSAGNGWPWPPYPPADGSSSLEYSIPYVTILSGTYNVLSSFVIESGQRDTVANVLPSSSIEISETGEIPSSDVGNIETNMLLSSSFSDSETQMLLSGNLGNSGTQMMPSASLGNLETSMISSNSQSDFGTFLLPSASGVATVSSSVTTQSTPNTTLYGPLPPPCPCFCNPTNNEPPQFTTMDKYKLSSFRRKRECSPDDRLSARVIGYSGILFIVLSFVVVLFLDVSRYFRMKTVKLYDR